MNRTKSLSQRLKYEESFSYKSFSKRRPNQRNRNWVPNRPILTWFPKKTVCVWIPMKKGNNYWSKNLFYHINHKNLEELELLLVNGADPNIKDKNGITPLGLAICCIFNNCEKFVSLLLEYGANPNQENNDKKTPLYFAIQYKEELINLLMKYGANINSIGINGNTLLHEEAIANKFHLVNILLKYGANINQQNKDGNTALHCAIIYDSFFIVGKLLDEDADYMILNNYGVSPFDLLKHEMCESSSKRYIGEKYIQCFEIMLKIFTLAAKDKQNKQILSEIRKIINYQDALGDTPMHYYVTSSNYLGVLNLLNYFPDISIENNSGKTPLTLVKEVKASKKKRCIVIFDSSDDDSWGGYIDFNHMADSNCDSILSLLENYEKSLRQEAIRLLILSRDYDENSLFNDTYLCLDLFKIFLLDLSGNNYFDNLAQQ